LGTLDTAATDRPIVPTPGDYDGEIGGMMIGKETVVLGENLPQCHFVHHKPHMLCQDANPGRRGWKPVTNRLSYGTATYFRLCPSSEYTETFRKLNQFPSSDIENTREILFFWVGLQKLSYLGAQHSRFSLISSSFEGGNRTNLRNEVAAMKSDDG
jgi:hypothetical protein